MKLPISVHFAKFEENLCINKGCAQPLKLYILVEKYNFNIRVVIPLNNMFNMLFRDIVLFNNLIITTTHIIGHGSRLYGSFERSPGGDYSESGTLAVALGSDVTRNIVSAIPEGHLGDFLTACGS